MQLLYYPLLFVTRFINHLSALVSDIGLVLWFCVRTVFLRPGMKRRSSHMLWSCLSGKLQGNIKHFTRHLQRPVCVRRAACPAKLSCSVTTQMYGRGGELRVAAK